MSAGERSHEGLRLENRTKMGTNEPWDIPRASLRTDPSHGVRDSPQRGLPRYPWKGALLGEVFPI